MCILDFSAVCILSCNVLCILGYNVLCNAYSATMRCAYLATMRCTLNEVCILRCNVICILGYNVLCNAYSATMRCAYLAGMFHTVMTRQPFFSYGQIHLIARHYHRGRAGRGERGGGLKLELKVQDNWQDIIKMFTLTQNHKDLSPLLWVEATPPVSVRLRNFL